jgi:hypothetical protein
VCKYCYGAKEEEWFFDDTQIEVTGKKFEDATTNYNGDRLLECELAGQRGVGECFQRFWENSASFREKGPHDLSADSGSSAGADLQAASRHFTSHSISTTTTNGSRPSSGPRTVMQRLLLIPMGLKRHARRTKAVLSVCAERLEVWQAIFEEWPRVTPWPLEPPDRPPTVSPRGRRWCRRWHRR